MFFVCCFLPISVLLPLMIMPSCHPLPFQFRQRHSLFSKIISGKSSFQMLRRYSTTLLWDINVPVSEAMPKCAVADEIHGWNSSFYATFLDTYWQKRPLLIRNAFPHIDEYLQISGQDYLHLAEDDDIETRIFTRDSRGKVVKSYGPFEPGSSSLPAIHDSNWTILLQEVDRHIPKVADLWNIGFPFIPQWRRDDVMISYSTEGGGIGAHVDNYDVFLVQGSGRREWAIENSFLSSQQEQKRQLSKSETRLLASFSCDQSWQMDVGDMLYLPPRIPHRGVTLPGGNCTTISFGFRAPNYKPLLTSLWEDITAQRYIDASELFHSDGALRAQASAGKIEEQAVSDIASQLETLVVSKLRDKPFFTGWLAKFLSEPLRYRKWKPKPFFLREYISSSGVGDSSSSGGSSSGGSSSRISSSGGSSSGGSSSSRISSSGSSSTEESVVDSSIDYDDFDDDDDDDEDGRYVPLFLREPFRVASYEIFDSAEQVLNAVTQGQIVLRRCEGIRMAYTESSLYVDGEEFPFPKKTSNIGSLLCDNTAISAALLNDYNISGRQSAVTRFYCGLIRSGFYYPVNN